VNQRANESEAELNRDGLGVQKKWLGSDSRCQRERSTATQGGIRYTGVIGQWLIVQRKQSRATLRGALYPEGVTRQLLNVPTRGKQSYAEFGSVSRRCECEETQCANDSEIELQRVGPGIQKQWPSSNSKCQRKRSRAPQIRSRISRIWDWRVKHATKAKQNYADMGSVFRRSDPVGTHRANESKAKPRSKGFSIQELWLICDSTCQESEKNLHREKLGIPKDFLGSDERTRATPRGARYPEVVTRQWHYVPTRA
jgi:hypothetical protein